MHRHQSFLLAPSLDRGEHVVLPRGPRANWYVEIETRQLPWVMDDVTGQL